VRTYLALKHLGRRRAMNINLTKHKRETTVGNVKADVLADRDPHFTRGNFCSVIRGSGWRG
jgi:hypothetical protein